MSSGSSAVAAKTPRSYVASKRSARRKYVLVTGILVVLCLFSLIVDGGYARLFDIGELVTCYGIALQQAVAQVTGGELTTSADILMDHPEYYRIVNRVGVTVMTALCGGVLAIAGALYQSAFRNPIASPSMLGVSSAIQLGDVILVLLFNTAAASMVGERYLICYVCVIVVMAALFAFARLMTGKGQSLNIINLLLIATVLTQLIGIIVTYITTYVFDYTTWQVYNNVTESLYVNLSLFNWGVLIGTCVVGLAPILIYRYQLNSLSFDDGEMKLLGIDNSKLRIISLVCGTVLLMAAQVQMGTIALLSLVVPHLCRSFFGADFRKQICGSVLVGAALLVACRIVVGLLPGLGTIIPVSTILNFVILPFFVWMIATQQRGWEE